jgi:hypothetical protein
LKMVYSKKNTDNGKQVYIFGYEFDDILSADKFEEEIIEEYGFFALSNNLKMESKTYLSANRGKYIIDLIMREV